MLVVTDIVCEVRSRENKAADFDALFPSNGGCACRRHAPPGAGVCLGTVSAWVVLGDVKDYKGLECLWVFG